MVTRQSFILSQDSSSGGSAESFIMTRQSFILTRQSVILTRRRSPSC
jgi:hypothetical protein